MEMKMEMEKTNFRTMLTQSAKDLRATKVDSIAESLELNYNSEINALILAIKNLIREQNDVILELYPDTTISTEIGKDFDPSLFINKDLDILLKLRELKIKLNILSTRFEELFGKKCTDNDSVVELLKDFRE